jgi:4-hydroxybenzoate polyprenyltransferase
MQKILTKIEAKLLASFEQKIGILEWLSTFSAIIVLRVFIEFFLASKAISFDSILIEYSHNFLFFALAIILVWLNLSFFLKIKPQKLSKLLFWSLWGILLPPIFDMIKTHGAVYWSFYIIGGEKFLIEQYFTFLSGLPSGIVYFGTKIIFLGSILLSGLITLIKTKKIIRAIFASIGTYSALFLIGAAPSLVALIYYFFDPTKKAGNLQAYQIIQLLATSTTIFGVNLKNFSYALPYNLEFILFPLFLAFLFLLFLIINKKKVLAFLKNARMPQLIYHSGLFFIGIGLGSWIYPENSKLTLFSFFASFNLLFGIWAAWLASVVVNDIYDFSLDLISNPERPLQSGTISKKEYIEIGWLFFYLSLFSGILISIKFAGLLLVYQILAWAYSARPYRLKRFPIIASLVSALASLIIFFIGFTLISGDQNIQQLSWKIILLLLIVYTLSLPIKDFKDITGDEKDGVRTIPVIFGEKNGRLIIGTNFFISFILSVFFLDKELLFFPALIFGSIAFLIMQNRKIHPRKVFWWILPVITVYGLVLVKVVFFD